jgi:hypothetical protein
MIRSCFRLMPAFALPALFPACRDEANGSMCGG